MNTILNINEKTEVKSYPYGRLRTSAFFSIEFDKKRGFRSVFQTIDPKSGRINKPKKSTYSDILYQFIEEGTGHVKTAGYALWGYEDINRACKFISENQNALCMTDEMLNHICIVSFARIKGNAGYTQGSRVILMDILKPALDALVAMMKSNKFDRFGDVVIDLEAIERLKKAHEAEELLKQKEGQNA